MLRESLKQVHTLSAQSARLLDELIQAEERERARIAAEIHDDTAQVLSAVSLRLEKAEHEANTPETEAALGRASREVREATVRLRSLMFELIAPAEDEGIRAAVESYCAVLLADTDISYELQGDPHGLSTGRRLLAYRLAQEALRNVVKHAQAGRVLATFTASGQELIMRICDDGVGLDAKHDPHPSIHTGLRMIHQRAEAAGGGARTGVGLDGRGTSIEIRMLLEEDEA